jgi:hypothetical protein
VALRHRHLGPSEADRDDPGEHDQGYRHDQERRIHRYLRDVVTTVYLAIP